jgi:hypothetical protein
MYATLMQTAADGVLVCVEVGVSGLDRLHGALFGLGLKCGGLCKCVLGGLYWPEGQLSVQQQRLLLQAGLQ